MDHKEGADGLLFSPLNGKHLADVSLPFDLCLAFSPNKTSTAQ